MGSPDGATRGASGATPANCAIEAGPFDPAWSPADVDARALWAGSGAQWLTAGGVAVPTELVRTVAGIVSYLDHHGAGLAAISCAAGVGLLAERAALLGLGPSGVTSCGGATRLLPCADGWIAVSLARPDDLASIPAWLGIDAGDDHWSAVQRAVADRMCRDVVEHGAALGLASASLAEQVDTRPVVLTAHGDAAPRRVNGIVVANLASLWAGPLAADILARLGARVINIESTTRPDGARDTPAFFEALHGSSESVALDLHTEHGRRQLRHLLDAVDVVIEGSRPRALEQMGVDPAAVVASGPKVWLSITAHGRDERNRNSVGFGDDAAVAGGLVGRLEGIPVFIADAVADPLAGLTAAATIVQLLETRGRWLADVALSRVAAAVAPSPADRGAGPTLHAVPPRPRTDLGGSLPLGLHTRTVLAEFGIDATAQLPRASTRPAVGAYSRRNDDHDRGSTP